MCLKFDWIELQDWEESTTKGDVLMEAVWWLVALIFFFLGDAFVGIVVGKWSSSWVPRDRIESG